jgi:FtsZ-interacting cell division protein YlmF
MDGCDSTENISKWSSLDNLDIFDTGNFQEFQDNNTTVQWDVDDNGTVISNSSSLNDLSVLEPQVYEDIKAAIPAIRFDPDAHVIFLNPPSSDEDDFSDVLPGTPTPVKDVLSTTDYLLSPLSPESVSPPDSYLSLSPSFTTFDLPEQSCCSSGPSSSIVISTGRAARETFTNLNTLLLKQELQYKIKLKRTENGQEELKVDLTPKLPTISYDAVQRRHEVRQKNKEYARQSRERSKHELEKLKKENAKLVSSHRQLNQKLEGMRRLLTTTDAFFDRHHRTCRNCSNDNGVCSVCSDNKKF